MLNEDSRILVTGSAGFIGSNLVHYLQNNGYNFVHLDGLFAGSNLENLDGIKIPLIEMDLADDKTTDKLYTLFLDKKITHIIHLAANSHVDRSISGDAEFWRSNVVGTANLLRTARRYGGISCIINQITDEFWGERPEEAAKETDSPAPTSPYPCSKAGQYFVGKAYRTTYNLPIISTFPVNCYGPRQAEEKLIPKFTTNLLSGKKVPLMASTHFERDWLPVIDICKAFILLLEKGTPGEDYNIGADRHHTNMEITKKLIQLCGRDDSYIEIVPDRAAHDCRYAVDSTKIKDLGFSLSCDFDEYLKLTVDWYKEKYAKGAH